MKSSFSVSLSFFLALSCCFTLRGEESPRIPVSEQIEEILSDSLLQKGTTGIRIIDAATGEVLFEQNGNKYFSPASNMKLITTAGALFLLKPEYRYKTPILTKGVIKGDTLRGDLCICGRGDPSLSVNDLRTIAQQVAIKGIAVIKGNVLFDNSYFDSIPFGPGWMWDDLQYPFSAPTSALSVNRNSIAIYVSPGATSGDSVRVNIVPEVPSIAITNSGKTGTPKSISVDIAVAEGRNQVTVRGLLPPDAGVHRFSRAISYPSRFTASVLLEELKREGISVTGTVQRQKTVQGADTLYIHTSEPLLKMLYDLDKYSSNFIAEHVLKTIGAEYGGKPGTALKGIEAIASHLQDSSITEDEIIQRDGSGLSRYNLVTPNQITSVLHYLYYCFSCGPELLSVLPVAGADGTMKSRLRNETTIRKVRAKTGTMTNVSSLSGYCITSSGRMLVFAIMMKDFPATANHVRTIQDRIVTVLIENL